VREVFRCCGGCDSHESCVPVAATHIRRRRANPTKWQDGDTRKRKCIIKRSGYTCVCSVPRRMLENWAQ
jgi:hypothetical protein